MKDIELEEVRSHFRVGDFVQAERLGWGMVNDSPKLVARDGEIIALVPVDFGKFGKHEIDVREIERSFDRFAAALNVVRAKDGLFRKNGYAAEDKAWIGTMLYVLNEGKASMLSNPFRTNDREESALGCNA